MCGGLSDEGKRCCILTLGFLNYISCSCNIHFSCTFLSKFWIPWDFSKSWTMLPSCCKFIRRDYYAIFTQLIIQRRKYSSLSREQCHAMLYFSDIIKCHLQSWWCQNALVLLIECNKWELFKSIFLKLGKKVWIRYVAKWQNSQLVHPEMLYATCAFSIFKMFFSIWVSMMCCWHLYLCDVQKAVRLYTPFTSSSAGSVGTLKP